METGLHNPDRHRGQRPVDQPRPGRDLAGDTRGRDRGQRPGARRLSGCPAPPAGRVRPGGHLPQRRQRRDLEQARLAHGRGGNLVHRSRSRGPPPDLRRHPARRVPFLRRRRRAGKPCPWASTAAPCCIRPGPPAWSSTRATPASSGRARRSTASTGAKTAATPGGDCPTSARAPGTRTTTASRSRTALARRCTVTGPEGLATSTDDGETWRLEMLPPVRDENGEVVRHRRSRTRPCLLRGMIGQARRPGHDVHRHRQHDPGDIGGIARSTDGGATWDYVSLPCCRTPSSTGSPPTRRHLTSSSRQASSLRLPERRRRRNLDQAAQGVRPRADGGHHAELTHSHVREDPGMVMVGPWRRSPACQHPCYAVG